MTPITRRNSMAGLLGLGAAAALPCGLRAAAPTVLPGADIPPEIYRRQQFAGDQILVGGIPCVGTANLTEKKRLILSFSAYLNNLTKPLTMRRNMK